MRIDLLELSGFKRLSLNNINLIRIVPKNLIQLILGTNGSGKSSLLKELSPLPGDPKDYHKGGYKYIEISKGFDKYKLKSNFGEGGNKFSFVKNDIDLNPGGTASVYKELCKKEFNITFEVHELMTGSTLFHQMSTGERRNWFTKISDTDYTYAIAYFQRLKEQTRDIQGAIKLNQSRLVQEKAKLISPEDEIIYRQDISFLQESVNSLLEIKQPLSHSRLDLVNKLNSNEQIIVKTTEQIFRLLKSIQTYEHFQSMDHVSSELGASKLKQQLLAEENKNICNLLESTEKTVDLLKNSNVSSLATIDRDMSDILEEVDSLYKQIRHNFVFSDNDLAQQAIYGCLEDVRAVCLELPTNTDRKISRALYERLQLDLNNTNNIIAGLEQNITEANLKKKEMEHLKEHAQIECPKCSHVWYKGYSEEGYQKLLKDIEFKQSVLSGWLSAKELLVKDLDDARAYLEAFRMYNRITSGWSVLAPVWEYCLSSDIIFNDPKKVPSILEDIRGDLFLKIKIAQLNTQYKEKEKVKDLASKDQELNLEKINASLEQLHLDLIRNQLNSEKQSRRSDFLSFYNDTVNTLYCLTNQLEQLINNQELDNSNLLSISRVEVINSIIGLFRMELVKREQLVSKVDIQKALIANIENQLIDLTNKHELLKIAVKELSPTEGLIAKGMTGFINHFITQLNAFIEKVWLYPLEIQPIEFDEEGLDLDYKFKVKVGDNLVISDVAKGSSAMREIIDLSFRIISSNYLGLKEGIFYADEPGASLDTAHRASLMSIINTLLVNTDYSQIFMISHYASMYGSLKSSDIIVLCPANITLPKDTAFNTTVEIS